MFINEVIDTSVPQKTVALALAFFLVGSMFPTAIALVFSVRQPYPVCVAPIEATKDRISFSFIQISSSP
jgi:hypothetical protein